MSRLHPYESRDLAEKILEGIAQGRTISEIVRELTKIPSSTIYKKARELEEAGFIEEV